MRQSADFIASQTLRRITPQISEQADCATGKRPSRSCAVCLKPPRRPAKMPLKTPQENTYETVCETIGHISYIIQHPSFIPVKVKQKPVKTTPDLSPLLVPNHPLRPAPDHLFCSFCPPWAPPITQLDRRAFFCYQGQTAAL